jgi:hypothetical protein
VYRLLVKTLRHIPQDRIVPLARGGGTDAAAMAPQRFA